MILMVQNLNTYWNENGKHQEENNRLSDLMPNWGWTDNRYVNLFIFASRVYYDVNNNGGGNLKGSLLKKMDKYLLPFAEDIKTFRLNVKEETLLKNLKNTNKLERFLDEIIVYLQDKDLSFEMHTLYFDNEKELLSESEIEGFNVITFGNEKDCMDWAEYRINNWDFKYVS